MCPNSRRITIESYQPIGVAAYKATETPPRSFEKDLPTPEQVAKLVEHIK